MIKNIKPLMERYTNEYAQFQQQQQVQMITRNI